jgi:hypothetical protein
MLRLVASTAVSRAEVVFPTGRNVGLPASIQSITSKSIPWDTIERNFAH